MPSHLLPLRVKRTESGIGVRGAPQPGHVAALSETSLLHAEHLMKAMRADLTRPFSSSPPRAFQPEPKSAWRGRRRVAEAVRACVALAAQQNEHPNRESEHGQHCNDREDPDSGARL